MRKFMNYCIWWERLFFQNPRHTYKGTSIMLISCSFAAAAVPWQIYNSLTLDPEVRLRPHKRAWHLDEHKIEKSRYRRSFIRPFFPKRTAYNDMMEDAGWEELPIPKLD
eukprot:173725_1